MQIVFPHVCDICGNVLPRNAQYVCIECLNTHFEEANPNQSIASSDSLLPEYVHAQHALWKFDKGGFLQDLMHKLKYQRLTGVGEDLGKALGRSLKKNSHFDFERNWIQIPVPLHPRKERKRGFNQARSVGAGIESILRIPAIDRGAVTRIKNTKTQTGYSLEKRRDNVYGAFNVLEPGKIQGKFCLVVDDVFTTGATSFELSSKLHSAGAEKIFIVTIAQA
ncbi:MAG: ComF family protein [Balneolales bacterium]|nr:ComF family protein [Balneolales bacterium]